MEMRDIQVFRAVMQAGTTSKAATLLEVSQPAVSQSIRKLEASSELRLFDRVRGRLVPTQEALALMVEVDRCFTGFEVIEHRSPQPEVIWAGKACHRVHFRHWAPVSCRARLPPSGWTTRRIQLSFQIMSSREVHQQVSAGQLDFGLMADELSVSGLEHSEFVRLPGVIVMNAQHPLARKKTIDADDLVSHPFLALNPEDASRRRLEQSLGASNMTLRPVLETPYSNSICEFALQGVGMGMAHPVQALDYLSRGLLLKPMTIETSFTGLSGVPGRQFPLSENAKDLLKVMRIQLEADKKLLAESAWKDSIEPGKA
jgi:DNA-binding transcriptional LysR family regulator